MGSNIGMGAHYGIPTGMPSQNMMPNVPPMMPPMHMLPMTPPQNMGMMQPMGMQKYDDAGRRDADAGCDDAVAKTAWPTAWNRPASLTNE